MHVHLFQFKCFDVLFILNFMTLVSFNQYPVIKRFHYFCRKEKESSEDKSEPFTRQVSHGDPAKPFLQALTESKLEDETALKFLATVERFCKQKRFVLPIDFPADHPVEKVGRMLMACLLKHQELGKFKMRLLPKSMAQATSTIRRRNLKTQLYLCG